MRSEVVLVLRQIEFAEADPFDVQGHDSALREIDAALLFVLGGFAERVVPVDVQNRRKLRRHRWLATCPDGLVENRRRPKIRENFNLQLLEAIVLPRLDHVALPERERRLHPFRRPTVKRHVVEEMAPQILRCPDPPCSPRELRDARHHVPLDLVSRHSGGLNGALQNRSHPTRCGLAPRTHKAYQNGESNGAGPGAKPAEASVLKFMSSHTPSRRFKLADGRC